MPDDHAGNTPRAGAAASPADRIRPFMWKKGQSGNPGGRPRNESLTARLRRVLAQEHNGREIADLIAERIVKEALSGKFPFAKELLDRLEGVPGKEKPAHEPVRIIVADYRTGAERAGAGDGIRSLVAPSPPPEPVETEVRSLREFYTKFPAPTPPGYAPPEGDSRGT